MKWPQRRSSTQRASGRVARRRCCCARGHSRSSAPLTTSSGAAWAASAAWPEGRCAAQSNCARAAAPGVARALLREPVHAALLVLLLGAQLMMMLAFLAVPVEKALWYSGFGVPLFVLGMMVAAFAVRGLA